MTMLSVYRNIYNAACKNYSIVSSIFITRNLSWCYAGVIRNETLPVLCREINQITCVKYNMHSSLEVKRYFSKKKGSKRKVEEEESDSEEEIEEEQVEDNLGDNIITRSVTSIRLDSILKSAFGMSKKKVDQDFYAFKLRINGNKVLKKAANIYVGDEIDRVKGFSPDTSKFLIVDRIIIKGLGNVTGNGMFPVKMEILRDLTVENYEDPWDPSSLGELEK